MNPRRFYAIFRKEAIHILRDKRSLMAALALPLVLLLMFGYALTLDVDRVPTLIYDQDESPESRTLIAGFEGSRYFTVQRHVTGYLPIERAINDESALLAVVIRRGFGADIQNGREAFVQILANGSDSNTASLAIGYAEATVQTYALELRADAIRKRGVGKLDPPVEPRVRVLYNDELKSKNYIVPGLIAVILMIISALLTSLTIAREWENGTMEQLLSTPVRPLELLLGKLSAFFVVGIADMLIAIVVGVFVFKVPLQGNAFLLFLTSCIFLFGALCWGIFLSTVTRSQLLAFQASILSSFLPAFLLSGFIYAIENMPVVIQVITHIVPARYFVTILKGIFLKGIGLEILWPQVLFLCAYAALLLVIATRKLREKVV
ncbi:MAG: ABC transporter permease [Bryobacteraceae bacterium]|nr:ABC transporter permease [Bryobacteraceae bacterium]